MYLNPQSTNASHWDFGNPSLNVSRQPGIIRPSSKESNMKEIDPVQVLDSNAGGLLVAIGDPDGVNAAVQQLLSLFQQGTSQD